MLQIPVEKSKWFYTEFKADTKAVVLLAHGLNLKASKMDELAKFFAHKRCDVLRLALGNDPKKWSENFSEDYEAAAEHAHVLNLPLYFVGYSLGALVGMSFISTHAKTDFKKLALFAPASHTKPYTRLPAILAKFFPKGRLPSLNLEDYRERHFTTLAEYKVMQELQKELQSSLTLPTLIIYNAKDELVSATKLQEYSAHLPQCRLLEVSNHESQLTRKYHHLMIDEKSLGQSTWQKVLQNLTTHFSL